MTSYEHFSSDQPVTNPNEDVLGYSIFAKNLAHAILKIPTPQGFVIAINGDWGLGKSSLISLILHYMEPLVQDGEKPLILKFSPWMFSGQEGLIHHFLEQLQAALMQDEQWRSRGLNLKKKINDYSSKLSDMPLVGEYAKGVHKLSTGPDVQTLKDKISNELSKHNGRIVIIIDDIDRLYRDEMLQLFRVIKAVANFPNTVYLVAFDKEIVRTTLSSSEGWDGVAWLDKIVQVSFDIPIPGEEAIYQLFTTKLNELYEVSHADQFDEHRWYMLYTTGIQHFLKTPRHVIRLINALSLTMFPIVKEVNIADFVSLETLRLFCPHAYDTIRRNKDFFIKTVYGLGIGKTEQSKREQFHESWLSRVDEDNHAAICNIIRIIFPEWGGDSNRSSVIEEAEEGWHRRLRVCTSDRYDVYFRLSLTEDVLSSVQVLTLLEATKNYGSLVSHFQDMITGETDDKKARLHLTELYRRISTDVDPTHTENVIRALLIIGDDFINIDRRASWLENDNQSLIFSVMNEGLKNVQQSERLSLVQKCFPETNSVYTVVYATSMWMHFIQTSPFSVFSKDDVEVLRDIALIKITEVADNQKLFDYPHPLFLAYNWVAWAGEDNFSHYLEKNEQALMKFVDIVVAPNLKSSHYDYKTENGYVISEERLSSFDCKRIARRVKEILEVSDITGELKVKCLDFIAAADAIKVKTESTQ